MPTFPERFHAVHLECCASTNDYVRDHADRLRPLLPLLLSADAQTAGRGREGRGWHSPAGLGLYATFAFHLPEGRLLSLLSIAAGVAVCDMLQEWCGGDFVLKWPNDVLAAGRKLAGILCENQVGAGGALCLVGIGLNLNQQPPDFPPELRPRAVSLLGLSGRPWPGDEARQRLGDAMGRWLRQLEADAGAVVGRARHFSRSFLGREILFRQHGRQLRGICRGLAADGGLVLETGQGRETVFYSGEIGG